VFERVNSMVKIPLNSVEIPEIVIDMRPAERVPHLLGESDCFLSVGDPFIELSPLSQSPH
jgi:hypothetical protein